MLALVLQMHHPLKSPVALIEYIDAQLAVSQQVLRMETLDS